jgi:ATP-dependent DNA helicase RecG
VAQLEKSGLIHKGSGHSSRYTLSEEYNMLKNDGLKIGKRYISIEIEQLLLALQATTLKIGDLEACLAESLNRNQLKYLISKLTEDKVIQQNGKGRGTFYSITPQYSNLTGDPLVKEVINFLRKKYEVENSPKSK